MVIEGFGLAIQMRSRSKEDKDVEDLVRAAPDIESAWCELFWPPDLRDN